MSENYTKTVTEKFGFILINIKEILPTRTNRLWEICFCPKKRILCGLKITNNRIIGTSIIFYFGNRHEVYLNVQ